MPVDSQLTGPSSKSSSHGLDQSSSLTERMEPSISENGLQVLQNISLDCRINLNICLTCRSPVCDEAEMFCIRRSQAPEKENHTKTLTLTQDTQHSLEKVVARCFQCDEGLIVIPQCLAIVNLHPVALWIT